MFHGRSYKERGGKMRKMTKLRRDIRGLSPIFAVLILIAIAVIGGIVVYLFTSGYLGSMTGGGSTGAEKIAIEAIEVDAATDVVTLHCKGLSGGDVLITDAILKDSAGETIDVQLVTSTPVTLPATGVMTTVQVTFTGQITAGYSYSVALVSQAGGQFLSSPFKA
jgi:flagellin-like protein